MSGSLYMFDIFIIYITTRLSAIIYQMNKCFKVSKTISLVDIIFSTLMVQVF